MGGAFASCVGVLVWVGWFCDIDHLKRVVPGFVAMNPMTAALFISAGVSLTIFSLRERSPRLNATAKMLAALVIAAGLTKLADVAFGWLPNVDEFFFTSKLSGSQDRLPNRMAPNTAFDFLLIGLSLLTLDCSAKKFCASQAFAILAAFGALLPLTGYAYGVQSFRGMTSFIPMALHTAVTFLVLATGLFFARADSPLTEVFATNDPRGVLARRLFPLAVLLTLLLGWLRVYGERLELYESAFGTALFAILLSILFAILVRWTVWTVGKLEAERAAATLACTKSIAAKTR